MRTVQRCLLAGLLALFSAMTVSAEAPRPNVILFLVDEMGWMDSGAYGSRYYETLVGWAGMNRDGHGATTLFAQALWACSLSTATDAR
jgi:hypothetical protein